jgi:membrane associated rhomboid family serine protease
MPKTQVMPSAQKSGPSRWSSRQLTGRWEDAGDGVRLVLAMLAVMWAAWIANALDHYHLDQYGILPRNVGHLYGILTAPFLHASFSHIFGNTIPFLILGVVIAFAGLRRVVLVTLLSILVSGIGVWLTATSGSPTIGASGVVFGFAAYLVFRGIFSRHLGELLIGLVVGAVFGLSLLADLIPHSGVSWQAHLFGGIGGVLAAALVSRAAEPAPRARA